jgi:ubiquitin carboxyl-terminal hydrolase 7
MYTDIELRRVSTIKSTGGCATATEFYDHLLNRITIRFSPRIGQNDLWPYFDLDLNRKMSYDQFAAKVGEHLKADPTHIRFMTVNATNGNPKITVKSNNNSSLHQIMFPVYGSFSNSNQRPDALYYEVMELSLRELETKKNLKVTWLGEAMSKEVWIR